MRRFHSLDAGFYSQNRRSKVVPRSYGIEPPAHLERVKLLVFQLLVRSIASRNIVSIDALCAHNLSTTTITNLHYIRVNSTVARIIPQVDPRLPKKPNVRLSVIVGLIVESHDDDRLLFSRKEDEAQQLVERP